MENTISATKFDATVWSQGPRPLVIEPQIEAATTSPRRAATRNAIAGCRPTPSRRGRFGARTASRSDRISPAATTTAPSASSRSRFATPRGCYSNASPSPAACRFQTPTSSSRSTRRTTGSSTRISPSISGCARNRSRCPTRCGWLPRRRQLESVHALGHRGARGRRDLLRPRAARRLLLRSFPRTRRLPIRPQREPHRHAGHLPQRSGRGHQSQQVHLQRAKPGNFSPASTTGTLQIEQPVTHYVRLRAGYIESVSGGLVILDSTLPDPTTNIARTLLAGSGTSRYRQVEITARVRAGEKRQMMFSYVRSRATGDLNDFAATSAAFRTPSFTPTRWPPRPPICPIASSPGATSTCRAASVSRR